MTARRPAEVFPPGEYLRDELEERGWKQNEFAEILGRPASVVNEIISGRRNISAEIARDLGLALETSPEYWIRLDAAYQLSKLRDGEGESISRRAKLYSKAPVKEMVRRGWIEPSENVDVLHSRVLKFLRIEDLDDDPYVPLHAARKSTSYDQPTTPAQTVWLIRAEQIARTVPAKTYAIEKLEEAIAKLKLLAHVPQEIQHVPRILSEAGVRFVVIEPLPSSKIDGACFWIDDNQPVIAMSVRFDRIDNFWFVLMHELAHVKQGVAACDVELEISGDGAAQTTQEREANEFAIEILVPQQKLTNFIARIRPLYSAQKIEAFARTQNVHPGFVVGQLHFRGELEYSKLRKMLVPVRNWITSATATDGWGSTLPADL